MEVRIVDLDEATWVVKTSRTSDEAARLRREAAQLLRAAHPGVVETAAIEAGDGVELRTRYAGVSLRQRGPMPAAELCGLGAAVATVLADLHDIGIVHGAVTADHILIGSDGRPMLCGFGASTSTEEGDAILDGRGLAAALSELLGPDAPRRLVRVLRQDPSVRRRATSARALAAALGAAMPDRRLPAPIALPFAGGDDRPGAGPAGIGPAGAASAFPDSSTAGAPGPASTSASTPVSALTSPSASIPASALTSTSASTPAAALTSEPAPPSPTWVTPYRRVGGAVLVAVIVVAVLAVGVSRIGGHRHPTTVPCPLADRGCGPLPVHNGAFVTASGTFTTGLPDPVVVLGRFACGTASLPAALDPRTGRIWTWLTWAGPTQAVTATPVTAPSGGTTLRVRPEASGCDQLEVIDASGTTTVLGSGVRRRA